MHILFIFPTWTRLLEDYPHLEESLAAYKMGNFRMAGLGIPTAARALPNEHTYSVVDENVGPVDYSVKPDLVGLSFFTPQATSAYRIADRFRSQGIKVIGGGIHPSMAPDDTLKHFDSVVQGPVEGLWEKILKDLAADRLQPRYRAEESQAFAQPNRSVFKDSEYLRSDIVQAARGCTLNCPVCVIPTCYGSTIQYKPVEDVVADIASLEHSQYYLADENLLFDDTKNRGYTVELLNKMIEAGINKQFLLAAYPFMLHQLDAEFAKLLSRAGCSQFYLVLGMDRSLTKELSDPGLIPKVKQLRRAGIHMMITFTLGHDGDPPEVEPLIADFCRQVRANLVEFTLHTPFPGTAHFKKCERDGRLLTRDWGKYNGANVVFQPIGQSPERLQQRYLDLWESSYEGFTDFDMNRRYMRGFGRKILEPE